MSYYVSREPWELAAAPPAPSPSKPVPVVREVLEWALTAAAVLLIVGATVLLAGPRLLGWQGVIVLSGSMEPAMGVGDLVFVDPTADVESIQEGDIITFRLPQARDQMVSHRVIEVVRDDASLSFRTKGDANEDPDAQLVPARDVVGTIRMQVPYVGQLAQQLRDPTVFYLVIGIPAVLLIANELRNIFRELGRKEARA